MASADLERRGNNNNAHSTVIQNQQSRLEIKLFHSIFKTSFYNKSDNLVT